MYYNRIYRIWVIDSVDCFLLSTLIGSIIASRLKTYLSEKEAMERLKDSIIQKSTLAHQSTRSSSISNSKKILKHFIA